MPNPEISRNILPKAITLPEGNIFKRPLSFDHIPRLSRTALKVTGLTLALISTFGQIIQTGAEAAGGGPTPTTIPDRTPTRTPSPTATLTPTLTPILAESQRDFHSEFESMLDLSHNVSMVSDDGSLAVGISEKVLVDNNLDGQALVIDADTMQTISNLLRNSLTTIARARNSNAREVNFGLVRVPFETNGGENSLTIRIDVVNGLPGLQENNGTTSRTQYGVLKALLEDYNVQYQTFVRLYKNQPFAESFFAFVDSNTLRIVVNGGDYPAQTKSIPEAKIPFWLGCIGGLSRRYAVEQQGLDGFDLEERSGYTITSGDDIYKALGCNLSNQGCITGPGGILQIKPLPSRTTTPTPNSTPMRPTPRITRTR